MHTFLQRLPLLFVIVSVCDLLRSNTTSKTCKTSLLTMHNLPRHNLPSLDFLIVVHFMFLSNM
eukprot:m.175751 g.175751  ORF g.175751 m.175751 type:complete len:63 (-) comp14622_c0_seq9:109-297(-)